MPQAARKEKPFPADTRQQLEQIIAKIHPHTCIILLGDLNCKLGRSIENLTGRWCAEKHPNAEGRHFLDIMEKYNLRAASTFFQPRRGKLGNATYLPRNPEFRPSQIDYILISSRWMSSIKNCKVKWGVSFKRFGQRFDHGLVECQFEARLVARKIQKSKDYSILKTDGDLCQRFDNQVMSNLSKQDFDQNDPAKSVTNLAKSINEAASILPCKKKLPLRKRHVSEQTKHLYNERQAKFSHLSKDERKAASHEISKSIRADYISYLDGIL